MLALIGHVFKGVVNFGLGAIASATPLGDAVLKIAEYVVYAFREKQRKEELQEAIEETARATAEQVRGEIAELVRQELADQSPEVQQAVAGYVAQVPALVRRSLRRPGDPSGTTVPPQLRIEKPEDLLTFLPDRPPRFRAGDRPLPGVPWELVEQLGLGGFGEVWKARNPDHPGITAALKFCLDPQAAKWLQHEAQLLERVITHGRHEGIVSLRQVYLKNDPPCLEYEYVAGGELTGLIREWHDEKPGDLPLRAARTIQQIAAIVGYAHGIEPPIVHRDLKPANVLVERISRGGMRFKITDFGIGVILGEQKPAGTPTALTTALRGAHTPFYASPQQLAGGRPDVRDDVYALAAIWYQMLTGDLAVGVPADWQDEARERGVGDELLKIMGSCLASKPERRPADGAKLAELLGGLLESRECEAPAELRPPTPKPVPAQVAAPANTLQHTGCSAGSIVIGIDDLNRDLRLRVHDTQPAGRAFVEGKFKILDTGRGTHWRALQRLAGRSLDASDFRRRLPEWETDAKQVLETRRLRLVEGEHAPAEVPAEAAGAEAESSAPAPFLVDARAPTIIVSQRGEGQFHSIGEAIKSAKPGTRIMVRPGVYRESLVLDRRVGIIGDGEVADIVLHGTGDNCVSMRTDHALLHGLSLIGRPPTGSATADFTCVQVHEGRIVLQDCTLGRASRSGVWVSGAAGEAHVLRCNISNMGDSGVLFFGGRGSVEDCGIAGAADTGISIRNSARVAVRRCRIQMAGRGLLVRDKGSANVEGCEIAATSVGIKIDAGSDPVIRRCTIHRQRGAGVLVAEGGAGSFEECEIKDNGQAGVEVQRGGRPKLQRCRIKLNHGPGVLVQTGGAAVVEYCDLAGNNGGAWKIEAGAKVDRRGNKE